MRRLSAALLLSLGFACNAAAPTPPVVEIAKPASPPPAPVAPPPTPLPPRPAIVLRGEGQPHLRPHVLGSGAPLGFTVSASSEGTIHVGDDRPRLSPDGALLAYSVRGRLHVARTDGAEPPKAITRFDKGEVRLLLGGFSPDGKALLFHQGKRVGEDTEAPLPKGFVEGFHLLTLADLRITPLAGLAGFDAWDGDSRHVLFDRSGAGDSHDLVRADTRGSPAATLQSTADVWGYGQITSCGAFMAYVLGARVMRAKPDGTMAIPVSPQGKFADYQWPRCSPDGARVAWAHRVGDGPNGPAVVEVADPPGAPRALHRCRGLCGTFGWESGSALLVLDGSDLYRVGLDGTETVAARGVADLVLPDP